MRPGSLARATDMLVRRVAVPVEATAARGVTLLDMMFVLGIIGTLSAFGLPLLNTANERLRLNQAVRDVERELQGAKQRAVGSNRPIRVPFGRPSAGVFRAVEPIGSPSAPDSLDSSTTRCNDTTYPSPPADRHDRADAHVDTIRAHRFDSGEWTWQDHV